MPLIWGLTKGPQRSSAHLTFQIPSLCAETVERGEARLGLVPVAEIARQGLEAIPDLGIASHGAVRSILLVSRVPVRSIQTLAADLSSRTSVQLARIVLREMYGVEPKIVRRPPSLLAMLRECDSALVIGDAALRVDPYTLQGEVLDLGAEWYALTGLPMVFALWAGKPPLPIEEIAPVLRASYEFGKKNITDLVNREYESRGITRELANEYLTQYIHHELGDLEKQGLQAFLSLAGPLKKASVAAL